MIKKLKETIKEIEDLNPKYLLVVDPGNTSTGIAVFGYEHKILLVAKELDGKNIMGELDKFQKNEMWEMQPHELVIVIEKPTYYGGRGAIAHASGRIGALYRIEGLIYGYLSYWTMEERIFELTALEWKGQLSKQITTKKVNQIYKLKLDFKKDDDKADAIAIGSRILSEW